MNKKYLPFWMLTIATFIGLVIHPLSQRCMFLDGVIYSVISRNLAENLGSFWQPHFTQTAFNTFYEHPPLVFGIQSLFFSVFGDHLYVERLYSLFTFLLTFLSIFLIWKEIFKHDDNCRKIYFLPFILWLTVPLNFWSYANNMLENTVTFFTLFSIYFCYKGLNKKNNRIIYLILSGMLILFAFLSKGPVTLFPLVFVPVYYFVFKNLSWPRAMIYSGIVLIAFLTCLVIIMYFHEAREFFINYFDRQVIRSITGVRGKGNRISFLYRLFKEILPLIIFSISVRLIFINKKIVRGKLYLKETSLFFIMALTASIPILISLKLRGYYLVPSLSLFTLAFAIYTVSYAAELIEKIKTGNFGFKLFVSATSILLLVTVVFTISQFGICTRNKHSVDDILEIKKIIPENSIISIPPAMYTIWNLHANFARHAKISLDSTQTREYLILGKGNKGSYKNYHKIDVTTKELDLYQFRVKQ